MTATIVFHFGFYLSAFALTMRGVDLNSVGSKVLERSFP
jgi:hypothetical protein